MITRCIVPLVCICMLSCGNGRQQTPPHSSKEVPPAQVPEFDGNRAFGELTKQMAFGPRVPGTSAHNQCLQYLQTALQGTGATIQNQPFEHTGYNGELLKMTNIFGSFETNASTRILLVAHWDSRPQADQDPDPTKRSLPVPGADDGASGVAILLEIARHLQDHPPAVGVDMLFVDGEDYGREGDLDNYLLGTKYFVSHQPPGFKPAFGILLDMVGDKDLEIPKEPNSLQYAPDIVDLIWSTAKSLGVYQFSDRIQRAVIDDHLPLNEAGIKTVDLIDFDYPPWHTTEDTADKCSSESLQAVGRVLMQVIYTQPE
ncbi:MAG TPA: M28 family peptidase [Bacteroidota bacterium]|nr:M28 family peptidase [Bacteroidota bacterium]